MSLTTTLLRWYRHSKRDLPWRTTRDPYRILVSELMLQQTQVDRVLPKYLAWITRFPTWQSVADASVRDLLHAWAGLGYNRRPLFLQRTARAIVAHGIPKAEDAWRKLPGIGPYTAAAVSAFASHERTIPIDTNVRRVVGRAWVGKPFAGDRDDEHIRKRLTKETRQLRRHWDVPQALMDLGATICTVRNPRCGQCPLRSACPVANRFMSDRPPTKRPSSIRERKYLGKPFPDRIYRGRLLAVIRKRGPTRCADLGTQVDPEFNPRADADWIRAMVSRLAKDGLLICTRGDIVSLPHS